MENSDVLLHFVNVECDFGRHALVKKRESMEERHKEKRTERNKREEEERQEKQRKEKKEGLGT